MDKGYRRNFIIQQFLEVLNWRENGLRDESIKEKIILSIIIQLFMKML